MPIIVYGYAGDSNVHLHLICVNMNGEEWDRRLPHLMSDIYRAVVSFAEAISGEHGINFDKKVYSPHRNGQYAPKHHKSASFCTVWNHKASTRPRP